MHLPRTTRFAALVAGLFLALSMISIDYAEARRGGSFGSRGTRTFQSAPPTRTAPQPTAPIERSMTPNTGQPGAAARQPQASPVSQQRPGLFNGFGGAMLRGLLLGGLIGALLGYGFGGLAGMFGFILQALLIAGAVMLLVRLFRSQPAREPAMAGSTARGFSFQDAAPREESRPLAVPRIGLDSAAPASSDSGEISLTQTDLDTFERSLTEVQEAFGREDHAALRRLVTPEMVSYLSEELADNARNGVRNDVSEVALHQADIAEAWREGDRDYATAALCYSSRDIIRDRATGKMVEGAADEPTETTELWTFVRQSGGDWKLSAIQDA
jgi:predicted lipid-binding transport protein (Tim44 family)